MKSLLLLLACLIATAIAATAAAAQATTVVIVRHAEKLDASADPALSAVGTARAAALADALQHADVTVVLTTQYRRTSLTGAVTAERAGVVPQVIPATNPIQEHILATVAAVREHAGRTILVVGHSNTVTLLVAALGGPELAPLTEDDYDDIFVLTIGPDSAPALVRATYGAPGAAGEISPRCDS